MTTITINSVVLENFKGIRHLQIDFLSPRTRIMGANQTGKTTIADAIIWCLFGKDSKSRSLFGIKTRDANGNEIPHLRHSVTLTISIDGTEHTYHRALVEQWARARGEQEEKLRGNTTECLIDGRKLTLREYQAAISEIISEETFRVLSTPNAFTSKAWEEQRELLTKLCPDIPEASVLEGMPSKYADIIRGGVSGDIVSLKYKAKKIMEQLNDIPARIEEVESMTPQEDNTDFDARLSELKSRRSEIIRQRSSSDNTAERKRIADALAFAQRRKINIELSAQNKHARQEADKQLKIDKLRDSHDRLLSQAEQYERKSKYTTTLIERCKETMASCMRKRDDIRRRWAENVNAQLQLSEQIEYCPTCGQALPKEQLLDIIAQQTKQFNLTKASVRKQLTQEADELKKLIAETEQQQKFLESDIEDCKVKILSAREAADGIDKDIEEAEKEEFPTPEEILEADANYKSILISIAEMEKKLDEDIPADDNSSAQEEEEVNTLFSELEKKRQEQGIRAQCLARIAELESLKAKLNTQLSEVELQQDALKAYQQTMDDILETQVNKHFKYVKFRLFKTLVNGDRVPYCEATVNGIPFADLNTAARINAGIDIINSISDYYRINAPIIIDNAEAVNQLINTQSQTISLYVTQDSRIVISD